jgi:hypothetical protein
MPFLHPGLDDIELFVLGRLNNPAADVIQHHLKRCEACTYTAQQLEVQIGFITQGLLDFSLAPGLENAYRA